jgi:Protein of unknown function (DUF2510)
VVFAVRHHQQAPEPPATVPDRIRGRGWLIDPTRRHQIRYWDGARWTERVSDNGRRGNDPLVEQPVPPVQGSRF